MKKTKNYKGARGYVELCLHMDKGDDLYLIVPTVSENRNAMDRVCENAKNKDAHNSNGKRPPSTCKTTSIKLCQNYFRVT